MIECTLRDLATEQALRHPNDAPMRGVDLGIPRSSQPLVASGRPTIRFRSRRDGADLLTVPVVSQSSFGRLSLMPDMMQDETFWIHPETSRTFESGCLRDGDVVVCTGTQFKVALVGPGAGAYVPASFAVIRMDDETRAVLDPAYLAGWLSTSHVRYDLIPSLSDKKTLSLRRFLDLSVPIPDMEVQRRFRDFVEAIVLVESNRWEASKRESELIDGLFEKVRGVL